MTKTFVLDTNILLHDPHSIFTFGENEVVIPAIVLQELDSKKREPNEVGRNAREVARIIKQLRKGHEGQLSIAVPLGNGGIVRIELNHVSFEKLQDAFAEKTNDNRIIAVALNLQTEFEESLDKDTAAKLKELRTAFKNQELESEEYWDEYYNLTGRLFNLITNDNLLLAKADALLIKVDHYENDRIENLNAVHKGYHEIYVPSELINEFYKEKKLPFDKIADYVKEQKGLSEKDSLEFDVFPQDFFILKVASSSKQSALARLLKVENELILKRLVIEEEEKEAGEKYEGIYGIKPRNIQQRMALELLLDPHVPLVCLSGKAGTGKTLIALAAALAQTEIDKEYKKVLVSRPVISMGKDIGYLPGEMEDKMRPWMQPIYDNLEFLLGYNKDQTEVNYGEGKMKRKIDDEIQQLPIQIEVMSYIRGRSIPDQFLLFDEVQNTTPHQMKTILTRIGERSKIILMGDPEQIDDPYLDATNNGLTYVMDRMKHLPQVGIVRLDKTERSTLADLAAKLL